MKSASRIIAALAVFALTILGCAMSGPPGTGWTTLVEGKASDLNNFYEVGAKANWRAQDGAIVADKGSGKGTSHLVTKNAYKDFQIYVEFWASNDANSGIFLRCTDPTTITDRSCYEVNIFDERKDPTYGTGGIVHFAEVNPMPKAGGKWNTYEITAKGRQITVMLNGQKTSELHNGLFTEGPITLQHGDGVIKFRKVQIKPL